MKTVIRNSYTPQIGEYCDTVVVDRESGIKYLFDCDGVFTEWSRGKTITSLDDYREKYKDTDVFSTGGTLDAIDHYVGEEAAAREAADEEIEQEIEDLRNNPDVVDIVGTYADLQSYDTSDLGDNDIIKVLQDETKNNATTYYKWHITSQTWEYIGEQGPFYTKSEADATFVPQTRTVNNKALSSNITLTAADVGALPDSTVIPTVNNATLTIQKNGTTVQTFTANQATNATANITVPVNTSDLNNDGDGQSPFATEDYVDTYGGKIDTIEVNGTAQPIVNKTVDITVPTKTSDLTNDSGFITTDSDTKVTQSSLPLTVTPEKTLYPVMSEHDYTNTADVKKVNTVKLNFSNDEGGEAELELGVNGLYNPIIGKVKLWPGARSGAGGASIITATAGATRNQTLYTPYTVDSTGGRLVANSSYSAATGSATTPIYADEHGILHPTTYSLNASVPSDAVFTDTTYSNMTGATSSAAGAAGLVPAPAAGDQDKYLKGDGTWATVQSGQDALIIREWS